VTKMAGLPKLLTLFATLGLVIGGIFAYVYGTSFPWLVYGLSGGICVFSALATYAFLRHTGSLLQELDAATGKVPPLALHHLKNSWKSFHDGLVRQDGRNVSTSEPEDIFSEELVFGELNLEFYEALPNILIGIGVFFTFCGLSGALHASAMALQADDLAKMTDALTQLFHAAALKFLTSLAGLFCSVVFSFLEKIRLHQLRLGLRRFTETLGNQYPPFRADLALAERIDPAASRDLPETLSEVARQLAAASRGLSSLSSEEIGRQVGEVMSPVFLEIRTELQALREIKADQGQQILGELVSRLREEVLEPMADKMGEITEATNRSAHAVNDLTAVVGQTLTQMRATVTAFEEVQKRTLADLRTFQVGMSQTLSDFQQHSRELHSRMSEEIAGVAERAGGLMDVARQSLESTLGTIGPSLHQMSEQIARELGSALARFQEDSKGHYDKMADQLQTVAGEAARTMQAAQAGLASTLGGIDATIRTMSEVTRGELEKFRDEYQSQLTHFFTEQDRVLGESLAVHKQGLLDVVRALTEAFETGLSHQREASGEFRDALGGVGEIVERLARYSASVGLHSGERVESMQALAKQSYEEMMRLEMAYGGIVQQLRSAMDASHGHMERYLEAMNERSGSLIAEFDTHLGRISEQLINASSVLTTSAEYLVNADQSRR